jgi:hypothetical protein
MELVKQDMPLVREEVYREAGLEEFRAVRFRRRGSGSTY